MKLNNSGAPAKLLIYIMKLVAVLILLIALFSCTSSRHSSNPSNRSLLNPVDTLVRDTLMIYRAQPHLGFNFDYLVYLPKGFNKNNISYLLVETTNTGANDSIEHHEKGARFAASRSSVGNYVARKLKIPLLVPIFPRPKQRWELYTHALDRETIVSNEFGLDRLDLQLLAIIGNAKEQLSKQKITIKDKFLMAGFSASGTFANRFSLLHAQKIKATAYGGINAIAILPIARLNGKNLNYPLGISDLKIITGKTTNLKAFKKLPKLLFMGALDNNDAVEYDDAYSDEERALVYELMGKQMIPQRWEFIKEVYKKNGVQADFRTYSNMGHGTDLKINNDLVDFFRFHSAN